MGARTWTVRVNLDGKASAKTMSLSVAPPAGHGRPVRIGGGGARPRGVPRLTEQIRARPSQISTSVSTRPPHRVMPIPQSSSATPWRPGAVAVHRDRGYVV